MSVTLEKTIVGPAHELASNGHHSRGNFDEANLSPENKVQEPYTLALTREMVATLDDAGHLNGLRYELIHGRILIHPMQSNLHSHVVMLIAVWLCRWFGVNFVKTQGGIDVRPADTPTNEPEPDFCVSVHPIYTYPGNTIPVSDALFIIEVSLTTLEYDKEEKANLYARSGIADYWVVDIENRQVIVFREPTDEGYSSTTPYAETETVAPLAKPEAGLLVGELLPPAGE